MPESFKARYMNKEDIKPQQERAVSIDNRWHLEQVPMHILLTLHLLPTERDDLNMDAHAQPIIVRDSCLSSLIF